MDIIMKKIYKGWRSLHLFTRTLIGFGIGVTLGVILGPQASIFEFLGTILLRLINMVVAPLVLCLLISAAADINDYRTLGKIGVKTIAVFMVTTIFAVIVGMFFALTFKVGKGVAITNEGLEATTDVIVPSIVDTLINIIPNNIFEALSESNLLQIIFFALIFGLAVSKLKEKGILVNKVIYGCRDAMLNITNMVLEITPLGVMGIMANVVGKYGIKILLPYGKVIIVTFLACIFFSLLIHGLIMAHFIGKLNVRHFFFEMKDAILFVISTCSSLATIPLTLAGTKRLGVDDKVSNFVIPFGAVVNMDGTAIYEAIAVIFAAQIYGIELSITQLLLILLSATIASIGTAGIPGSGLVMLVIVLNAAGLPIEAVGLLAGIDRILNMARVGTNIIGDAATAVVVAKTRGEMREAVELYKS